MTDIAYFQKMGIVAKDEYQAEAIKVLADMASKVGEECVGGAEEYMRKCILPFWERAVLGNLELADILKAIEMPRPGQRKVPKLAELNLKREDAFMMFATERAIRVLRPDTARTTPLANLLLARECFGTYKGIAVSRQMKVSQGDFGERGALARHASSYEIKEKVLEWYRENGHEYPSLFQAAQAVVKEQPIEHSTAYKYLREWRKSSGKT